MSLLPLASAKNITLIVRVDPPIEASAKMIRVTLDVIPPTIQFAPAEIAVDVNLTINKIPLPIKESITNVVFDLLNTAVDSYFDQDRKAKTLFNFGDDYQAIMNAWRFDDTDPTKSTILVRLYEMLPAGQELATGWITRELALPVIDNAFVYSIQDAAGNVYLRPPNTDIKITGISGRQINNVTLGTLLTSASSDIVKPNDPIVSEWFTDDVNSTELNLDYANFNNFVVYSSAKERINAFKNKLELIEDLDERISYNSSSLSTAGIYITGTLPYQSIYRLSEERITILRSFDAYERFLYYGTGSEYSSSFNTDDYQDQLYFLSDATWPKVNGQLISIESASNATLYSNFTATPAPATSSYSWLDCLTFVASEYDAANANRLVNNLPEHIKNDENSTDYIKFFDMVGHHFDSIKLYVDQMTNIYDRQSNPLEGLSPDIVWNIAKSFGVDLPNQYSINTLVDYTIGEIGNTNPVIYRTVAAETWKRFMHNQMFILKSKGTKTALRALLNSYGVLPTTIQIKESSIPSFAHTSGTFEEFEEQTNALSFNGSSYIQLPFSASTKEIKTLEFRFKPTVMTSSVLISTTNAAWSLNIIPVSGTYAKLGIYSASFLALTSSAMPMFDGDYYSVKVSHETSTASLSVQKAEGDNVLYSSTNTELDRIRFVWNLPQYIFIAGSGSSVPFTGYMDEFRMWGEVISSDTFAKHVRYPGLYNGNTSTSARDYLYIRLSFNTPKNLGSSSITQRFIPNESPYINSGSVLPIFTQFSASGFTNTTSYPYSMTVENRNVLRYTYNAGTQYSTEKTVIMPTQTSRTMTVVDNNVRVPILSRDKSILSYKDRTAEMQADNTVGFYFSLTEAINDSIIRSVGNVNIQDYIGSPSSIYDLKYDDLETLNKLYWTNYAYTFNVNSFIDFVDNLLDPLFSQAKQLVPVRAKLLAGIVHEPHILQRSKLKQRPMSVNAGPLSRNRVGAFNLSGSAIQPMENSISMVFNNFSSSLVMDNLVGVAGTFSPKSASIYITESLGVRGALSLYSASIARASLVASLSSSYTNYTDTIRVHTDYVLTTKLKMEDTGNTGSGYFPMLKMKTNFERPESYMYFSNRSGLVAVSTFVTERVNQSILTARGVWGLNVQYSRNEYVSESLDIGYREYVCVTPDGTFQSNVLPSLDTRNWKPMRYISSETRQIKEAALISGSVNFVQTGSGYTLVYGYRPEHFKFTRDTRTGTIRHQWVGCVQTDGTTINGKPVVERLLSPEATLVVTNGSEPISPLNNIAGTILEVQ